MSLQYAQRLYAHLMTVLFVLCLISLCLRRFAMHYDTINRGNLEQKESEWKLFSLSVCGNSMGHLWLTHTLVPAVMVSSSQPQVIAQPRQ